MGCIESLRHEIILRGATFRECREYVDSHFTEYHVVPPAYGIFDVHIIGIPPIHVGVEGDWVIFPYTKPCHGTFLLRVESPEEVARLRAMDEKKKR